ncbi:hypothetical protein J6S37_02750 [Candidatus Saccharibacteria bacterium]|nr:hypothetical protein [Candidatus Saccharibacteria bacterium]
MVMSYTKTLSAFAAVTTIALLGVTSSPASFAVDSNTNFNVNVKEAISVSVTTPSTWASGNIDTFLRNKISVSVTSNNSAGFTATMSSKTTNTSLTNTTKSSYTLPTLAASSTRGNFPANYWGYSLDDTDAGSATSTYNAMVASNATPITLISSASATTGSKDFYFGAKGNVTLAAGTYTGTVVINVVSGVIDNNNPIVPTNPATPGQTDNTAAYTAAPTGSTTSGSTTYTYHRTSSGTEIATTEVSEGNNVSAYVGYTPPQGETYRTNASTAANTLLTTGLATAASIATASGMFFFILVSQREDDDDEEAPQN